MEGIGEIEEISATHVPVHFLVEKIKEEISCVSSSSPTIHKVPHKLRVVGEDAYQPRIISIGPYHHGEDNLQGSEKFKATYVHSIVSRGPDTLLMDMVHAIRDLEFEIRKCYEGGNNILSEKFIRMMIFDGCFVLQLLNKYKQEEATMESNDSIFSTTWTVPSLRRDLVLLENQIPFFVLDRLYNLIEWPSATPSLLQLVLDFFDPILPTISISRRTDSFKPKHILDLLRIQLLHPSHIDFFWDNPIREYTTCATDLQAAGVKFRRNDSASSLLDINFTRYGEFEMPPFFFGESWTVLFPNLIALEQCRRDYPDRITSYVLLINKLISSPSDVKLLRDKGIIDGFSSKDEKVVHVIGDLLEEIIIDQFYYDLLFNSVNTYCSRYWNRCRRAIIQSFLRNPLVICCLVAVILLFLIFMSVR